MSNKLYLLLLLCLVSLQLMAQRTYLSHQLNSNSLEITTSDGKITITPYTEDAFQVQFHSKDTTNYPAFAVVTPPQKLQTAFASKGNTLQYGTETEGALNVQITKTPFNIRFYYGNKSLTYEADGYFDTDSLKGFKFSTEKDEHLYGGGERALPLDRSGYRLPLYNKAHYGYEEHSEQMNYGMPLVISSKNYAILFDNPTSGFIDFGKTDKRVLSFEALGGNMTYFIIGGNTPAEVTTHLTKLTGRQPLPPRWAFGNFASRFGYHSQQQVKQVADQFRQEHIPLDAVVLDLFWFGPQVVGYMGNLDWYRDAFPNPDQMIENLNDKGIKTVLITEPFILTTSKNFPQAVSQKVLGTDRSGKAFVYQFFFGETGLVDIFKPRAKRWFWSFYDKQVKKGVEGWWGDLGEPEVHPSELQHINGSADLVHNAYGHEWAKMIYEGYEKNYPDKRLFMLMRSGFVGSQRYGLIPWSGDVNRTFGGLKPQVNISLTMGMSGLGYMHSDLGGFAIGEQTVQEVEELYIRWMQYGVFQPIYRPHSQEGIPSEVIYFKGKTKDIVKRYIEMRYKLHPYIYSLAFENSQTGMPLMRPLFFEEPNNRELLNYDKSYLFGDNILVTPITSKGEKTAKTYLPQGNQWVDFWTDRTYNGGQWVTTSLTMDDIPVFVKGGSFIPMSPLFQSLSNYNSDSLTIHYFADPKVSESNGQMYDDDGKTKDSFKKGQYELMTFSAENKKGNMTFTFNQSGGVYTGQPETRKIELVAHQVLVAPKKVKVNKDHLDAKDYHYNLEKQTLSIPFNWKKGEEVIIKIK
ncbi:TIM-barrel domain-containing protein [Limibacter armeniacum]|uniref:TIM-barrel domain-containing protein n=1 Tax=Limibacter armeniacum TaxID=466084 RepID=UPI002FE5CA71